MRRFLIRRLVLTIPVMIGVGTLVFSMLLVPGDPVLAMFYKTGETTQEQMGSFNTSLQFREKETLP